MKKHVCFYTHRICVSIIFLTILTTCYAYTQNRTISSEGEKVFNEVGCSTCHGVDTKGTQLGPALTAIKKNGRRRI